MYNASYYNQQQQRAQAQYYGVPQLAGQSNSCYSTNHAQLPAFRARSISQPVPPHHAHAHGHAHVHAAQPQPASAAAADSGLVLQSMASSSYQQLPSLSNIANCISAQQPMIDISSQLQQFSNYSQPQLQSIMAQYPQWLQKEYMRRLQRQYEEMYVVEDPKILHQSSICPRATNLCHPHANKPQLAQLAVAAVSNAENVANNAQTQHTQSHMLAESDLEAGGTSCEYWSESTAASPSPYAYSPHTQAKHYETTSSPQQQAQQQQQQLGKEEEPLRLGLDGHSSSNSKWSPSAAATPAPGHKRDTCFSILDLIAKDVATVVGADEQPQAVEEEEMEHSHADINDDDHGDHEADHEHEHEQDNINKKFVILEDPEEEDELFGDDLADEFEAEEPQDIADDDDDDEEEEEEEDEEPVATAPTGINGYISNSPRDSNHVHSLCVDSSQSVSFNAHQQVQQVQAAQTQQSSGYYTTNVMQAQQQQQQQQKQQQLEYAQAVQRWYQQQQAQQQQQQQQQQQSAANEVQRQINLQYQQYVLQQQQQQQQLAMQQMMQRRQQYLLQQAQYVQRQNQSQASSQTQPQSSTQQTMYYARPTAVGYNQHYRA